MIVTSLAIAGAGTLGYSVKVYREEKRLLASRPAGKKEFPWTVAAERMAKNQLVRKKRKKAASPLLVGASLGALTKRVREMPEKLSSARAAAAFSSDLRSQQLEELSSASVEVSEAEKKANQEFLLSSALLGLTSVGNLFYPPLGLLSVPGLVYAASLPSCRAPITRAPIKQWLKNAGLVAKRR